MAGDDGVETARAQTELAPMARVEVNLLDFALIYSIPRLTQNISTHTSFLITWYHCSLVLVSFLRLTTIAFVMMSS